MHRIHWPLLTWAHAIFWIVSSSEGIAVTTLTKMRGIPCASAWYLEHHVRSMMTDANSILTGVVAIDNWTRGQRPKGGENHFTLTKTRSATDEPCRQTLPNPGCARRLSMSSPGRRGRWGCSYAQSESLGPRPRSASPISPITCSAWYGSTGELRPHERHSG